MCKKAWAKVGAAPYTRACLTDTKVCQELGDADNGMNALMISLQEGNTTVCALLKTMGYGANHLQVQVKQVRMEKKKVTMVMGASSKWQKRIVARGVILPRPEQRLLFPEFTYTWYVAV